MLDIVYLLHANYGSQSDAVSFFSKVNLLTKGLNIEMRLVCLVKGFPEGKIFFPASDFSVVHVPNVGRDIFSYMHYAKNSKTDFLMFFNTSSQVHSSDFFQSSFEELNRDSCGATAATGSAGGIISSSYFLKLVSLSNQKIDLTNLSKAFLAKFCEIGMRSVGYSSVPHLRTNAFGISRINFIRLINRFRKFPTDRLGSLFFESGKAGFSQLLRVEGKSTLVIDKYGQDHSEENWMTSRTFCSFGQSNLAVSDNRTYEYQRARKEVKRKLFVGAWHNDYYFRTHIKNLINIDNFL